MAKQFPLDRNELKSTLQLSLPSKRICKEENHQPDSLSSAEVMQIGGKTKKEVISRREATKWIF